MPAINKIIGTKQFSTAITYLVFVILFYNKSHSILNQIRKIFTRKILTYETVQICINYSLDKKLRIDNEKIFFRVSYVQL